MINLLEMTDRGLYCRAGAFHIDPWLPVERAVLTHAHADHARPGSAAYLAAAEGALVLRTRLGSRANIDTIGYGVPVSHNGVAISFHPAGHILGSAQVRIEHQGFVAVVSGDYKLQADVTCAPFEPVPCHLFVTESTFGLPEFRWPAPQAVHDEINAWWRENREAGKASLLFGYSLGKAQRLLAGLDATIGPIFVHLAVARMVKDYRCAGVLLPPCTSVGEARDDMPWHRALILAPPALLGTPWVNRFGPASTGLASGWMLLRSSERPSRRRARSARARPHSVDRGFVLSDHADWPGLLEAVRATGAQRIAVTHGSVHEFAQYLGAQGLLAEELPARFPGESEDQGPA